MNYTEFPDKGDAASLDDAAKKVGLAEIERLIRQVETRQGGSGDYTKEKQERTQEEIDRMCAEFEVWVARRRAEGL